MNRLGFFAFLFFAIFCQQHIVWGQGAPVSIAAPRAQAAPAHQPSSPADQDQPALRCENIETFLKNKFNKVCDKRQDSKSILAEANKSKKEADQLVKNANSSIASAREQAGSSMDVPSVTNNSETASQELYAAVGKADLCAELSTQGINDIDQAYLDGRQAVETCADEQKAKNLALLSNFKSQTQSCIKEFRSLNEQCTSTSSGAWETAKTVGLWTLGIGAVGGAGYLIGRNNGKKRGGGGGGGAPAAGGGSDSQNRPNSPTGSNVGSTDGCAPGQARNLQGKCVTVNNPYPGVGATPEPFSNQNSNSSVNIGSDTGNPSSKNLTSNPTSRNLVNSGTPSGNSTTQDSSTSGGTGSSGGQANNSTSGGDTSSGSRAASQSNNSSEGSSFGDSAGANAGDESKNSAAVTESTLSGGNLYPYKVGTTVKYLSYKQCINNVACRAQNKGIIRKEKKRLKRLIIDSKFLD